MEAFKEIFLFIVQCLWFFLPIGFANMAPVLVKKHFTFADVPIDGGIMLKESRLFGAHKTWRGVLAAVIYGSIVFWIQRYLVIHFPGAFSGISFMDYQKVNFFTGALMGLGAITGDLIKSFFKRRLLIPDGSRWIPFDQIDYIIGGLLFVSFMTRVSVYAWLVILIFGFILHILINRIGYALGIKETKW